MGHGSDSSVRPTGASSMPQYVGFPVSVIIAGFCVMSMAYLICFCCCIIQFFVRRNRNPGSPNRTLASMEGGAHKQKNDKLKRHLWRQFQNSLRRFRKNRPSSQVLADSSCVGFCPICFEEYKGDPAEILVGYIKTCGHFFHFECIWEWLENHRTCPLCRGPAHLRETDIKGLALRHVEAYKDCALATVTSSTGDEVKKVPADDHVVEAGPSGGTSLANPASSGVQVGEEATEECAGGSGDDPQPPGGCGPGSIVVSVDIEAAGNNDRQIPAAATTTTTNGAIETVATPSGLEGNQTDRSTPSAQGSPQEDATPTDAASHVNPAFVSGDEAT